MEIPVLLAAPASQTLRDVVDLQRSGALPEALSDVMLRSVMPERFRIDPSYAPVPTMGDAGRMIWSDPREAPAYLIRGTVEIADLNDLPEDLDGSRVFSDAIVDLCPTCFDGPPVGTRADVEAKLGVATLHEHDLNGEGVAIAIVDAGLSLDFLESALGFRPRLDEGLSWTPPGLNIAPGAYPAGHGTMCAYAALLSAPNATLIDIPALLGTPEGGAPIGRRVSEIYAALAPLFAKWAIAFTPSGDRPYKGLVLSNSWAMLNPAMDFPANHPGRYADNPDHLFTSTLDGLINDAGLDVMFAAGNCGPECPDARCGNPLSEGITGANASNATLTVAGCDIAGTRVGYSSRGPGVPGMAREKPDLAAYTHFSGSQALGPGSPDKGTSTSCPIAAGVVAALRTGKSSVDLPPQGLNAVLRETASNHDNWGAELGHGILDPIAAGRRLNLIP